MAAHGPVLKVSRSSCPRVGVPSIAQPGIRDTLVATPRGDTPCKIVLISCLVLDERVIFFTPSI